jgi:hypothetical protein
MNSTDTALRTDARFRAAGIGHANGSGTMNGLLRRMRLRFLLLRIVAGRAPDVEQVLKALKP